MMNDNTISKTGLKKAAAAATGAITLCVLLFGGLTQMAAAAELGGVDTVATTYTASAQKNTVPEGYVKANYKVVADELYQEQPGAKDLTMGEAAEMGAQMVWEVFDADLEGATIYMGYCSGTETFPRPFWSGDIRYGDQRTPNDPGYGFMIDAVTGERFSTARGRVIEAKADLGLDAALAKHPEEYEALAKTTAQKLDLVHGGILSAQYQSQGYSGNDPTIGVVVTGVNGEKAHLDFSRYDRQLIGVSYDAERKISEPALQKLLAELEKKAEAMPKSEDGPCTLIALP